MMTNNPLMGNMANGMNIMQQLQMLRQNPMQFLRQRGFNVPDNVTDPQAIIQHLMNSGQVSQQQMNQAQAMAQGFGLR